MHIQRSSMQLTKAKVVRVNDSELRFYCQASRGWKLVQKRGRSLKYGAERSEVRATNTAVHEGMHARTVWQTL